MQMERALYAKNKVGFIDGTITKPEDTGKKVAMWRRCNNLVMGWLLCNLETGISKLFMN